MSTVCGCVCMICRGRPAAGRTRSRDDSPAGSGCRKPCPLWPLRAPGDQAAFPSSPSSSQSDFPLLQRPDQDVHKLHKVGASTSQFRQSPKHPRESCVSLGCTGLIRNLFGIRLPQPNRRLQPFGNFGVASQSVEGCRSLFRSQH